MCLCTKEVELPVIESLPDVMAGNEFVQVSSGDGSRTMEDGVEVEEQPSRDVL